MQLHEKAKEQLSSKILRICRRFYQTAKGKNLQRSDTTRVNNFQSINILIMPSNQKRHVCVYCGSKRVENKMKASFYRGYKAFGWHCDLSKIPKGSSVSIYCSNRTPQDNSLTLIKK